MDPLSNLTYLIGSFEINLYNKFLNLRNIEELILQLAIDYVKSNENNFSIIIMGNNSSIQKNFQNNHGELDYVLKRILFQSFHNYSEFIGILESFLIPNLKDSNIKIFIPNLEKFFLLVRKIIIIYFIRKKILTIEVY